MESGIKSEPSDVAARPPAMVQLVVSLMGRKDPEFPSWLFAVGGFLVLVLDVLLIRGLGSHGTIREGVVTFRRHEKPGH
jgi:hypothetical protein